MIQNLAAAAGLALILGGCAALEPETRLSPQPGAEGVEMTKQQNGRFIAFVSKRLQHTEPFLGVAGTNFFCLRSWLDTQTGEVAHQVYVADSYYGGPNKWDGVHDADSKALRFIAIGRNEITCDAGCAYFDEFAAVVPEDVLKAHRDGLSLTFTAKDGKPLAITVPGRLVAEELTAVNTVRDALPRAGAAPAAAGTPAPATAAAVSPPAAAAAPVPPPAATAAPVPPPTAAATPSAAAVPPAAASGR
ncbi:MAG TPA: hypothetical protein VET89_07565 [Stellaceae bacterium]|nr:hypothetical protein [Stellaceae bacterium]